MPTGDAPRGNKRSLRCLLALPHVPQAEAHVEPRAGRGGPAERAADYIAEHVTKPVVAYIAGFTAPPGKQMGHAGAIISGSSGTAEAKKKAFEAKGVQVGRSPSEAAQIAAATINS